MNSISLWNHPDTLTPLKAQPKKAMSKKYYQEKRSTLEILVHVRYKCAIISRGPFFKTIAWF